MIAEFAYGGNGSCFGFGASAPNGGNWAVIDPHFPVVLGGTYVARKLGINNLKDVP